MIHLFISMLLLSIIHGFDIIHHETGRLACTSRYEYRNQMLKKFPGCSELIKHNKICGEDILISYSEHPPYVWKDGDRVVGILPSMIRDAIETCCYNCNNISFIGPFEALEKFESEDVSLVIPVQTSTKNTFYFGHDYIHMIEVKAVSFIGPAMHHDPTKMVKTIFSAVFNTWPLFIIAFAMAIVAGIAMWLLDNKWNEGEFPDSFPRGPFEGFWWAVVSMTTVGYGDRSPKSTIARIFAILWIVTGITLFSMYTATLTSALTSAVISSHDVSLYQRTASQVLCSRLVETNDITVAEILDRKLDKRIVKFILSNVVKDGEFERKKIIGILNTTTVGVSAVMQINAKYKGYQDIDALQKALLSKEIDVAALDENIVNHFIDEIMAEDKIHNLALYERLNLVGVSYGMLSFNNNMSQLFKSFYESNDDQRDIMLKAALKEFEDHSDHGSIMKSNDATGSEIFTSMKMFVTCLVSLVAVGVLLTLIGLFIKWINLKAKKKAAKLEEDVIPMNGYSTKDDDIIQLADQLHHKLIKRMKHVT